MARVFCKKIWIFAKKSVLRKKMCIRDSIIHGAANAMYLPKVIAFNAKDPEAKKRYGVIADEMKLGGANDDEKVKLLIEYLRGMNDALNIPCLLYTSRCV